MQRYFAKDYKDELILENSDIHHIKNVMRMRENDLIEVVYDNKLYICSIKCLNPFLIELRPIHQSCIGIEAGKGSEETRASRLIAIQQPTKEFLMKFFVNPVFEL